MRTRALTAFLAAVAAVATVSAAGQNLALNESCTVSVLNRSVQVDSNGAWVLPNVPSNIGLVRARATCVENGITRSGQSDYFLVPPNGIVQVAEIKFDAPAPIPATLRLTAPSTSLGAIGATLQVTATATYANGTSGNISLGAQGTNWFTSNPRIATVSADGLVTSVATGNVLISAMNEGALGMVQISIVTGGDSDGDGIPDDFEISNGLDPANPADAAGDLDNDGLTNLQEYQRGTLLHVADTDGDGLRDGDEISAGTNPLLADTDGDGIRDGLEVQTGSNPLDPSSYNLALALQTITVTPNAFEIVVNTLVGEASRIVAVTGNLKDGTTINLTARSRGTTYSSSNLGIASFGAVDGQIFGGSAGTATVTVANGGHTATATVTVRTFAPQPLSFLQLPGFANNVDVAGNYAYVAAGSAGLVIVDVTNRRAPVIVKTVDTPGNANDVHVVGTIAYVADGASGLQVIDVTTPATAHIIGTLDTDDAWDLVVYAGTAYLADGASGLRVIDVRNGAGPVLLGTYDTNGVAKGVDVAGRYAVVADGNAIVVIDVATPSVPTFVGAVAMGDVRDVVAEGTFAYAADMSTSLQVVDFSNPASPSIVATADRALAGIPTDVAKVRELVFASDIFFVNGVSVTDVRSPANPTVRARLDFPQRDDQGVGIAVDHQFVYLAAERCCGITQNGTSGDTALYIGQYLFAEDTAGIAPSITLTSPVQQPTAVEGGTLRIAANATDDILVASVDFIVNGQVIATDTVEPYEVMYSVPVGVPTLTISARATDLANNSTTTPQVIMSVIPDPGTTVTGRVVTEAGTGAGGATIVCSGKSATALSDGTFSVASVPTITGVVRCTASYLSAGIPYTGVSASVSAIPGGTTSTGNITVHSALQVVQFPKSAWAVDGGFLARTLAMEGNYLLVGPWSASGTVVTFDVSDPANPVRLNTRTAGNGEVYDLEVKDGVAYVASYDFCTMPVANGAGRSCVDYGGGELSVAVKLPYVFASTNAGDGRVRLFDVTTPSSPRRVREQGMVPGVGYVQFLDLVLYGPNYLIGISADEPGGVGHEVVVIDISDLNSWKKVAELDVPNYQATRGKVQGNRLYLASQYSSEVVVVDLTNPAAPAVVGRRAASNHSPGVWPLYNELFVAAGTDGLVSLDVTTPASPVVTRTVNVGGNAWDVVIRGNYAYVANETGLAVAGFAIPPSIDVSRITLERAGGLVTARGAVGAITGQGPLTAGMNNVVSGASVSGLTVASDGSFTASVPAASGEGLTLTAIDAAGRIAGPVSIGTAPVGNTKLIPLRLEDSWRARTLAVEGSMLVVHGWGEEYGTSGNAIVFDISNPFNPVQRFTRTIANGQAYDTEIVNGIAYNAGWDFCMTNLNDPNAGRQCVDPGSGELGVAVSGRYAFTSGATNLGAIRVYDVSNGTPRFIRNYNLLPSNANFYDLIAYGSNYLIAISPDSSGGQGHDVVVVDRRDVNNLVKVADLDIPNFQGFRGEIRGTTLYLASANEGTSAAIVDLSNPLNPQLRSVFQPTGKVRGVDASGTTLITANGTAGVTMYDVSNPASPVKIATADAGGSAWDVVLNGGAAYVAAEAGLVVIGDVTAPPVVDVARIAISVASQTTATVTGQARSISGISPLKVAVQNTSTGVSVNNIAVAGDGSFTATIAARSGETLAVAATDGNNRTSGNVTIGPVPFGSATITMPIAPGSVGDSFRARDLASEGTMLVVSGWGEDFGTNGNAVVYDISNPAAPVQRFIKTIANGQSYDVELVNGWAYDAGWDFCVTNLNDPNAGRVCVDPGSGELGVAVSGRYAFTSGATNLGAIRMYDVSNPAAPRFIRNTNFLPSNANFFDLIAYGPDYLIALSPDDSGGTGHDVVVIDRRDVNALVKVAELDIPNFRAFRGRIYGNTLYIASAHDTRPMAIVDLTNPLAPVLKSIVDTGGWTRGVSVAGNIAATADLSMGVSFTDVTNPAAPRIQGSQFVGGNPWDALFANGALYVANEQGIVVFRDVIAPPIIDGQQISIAATTSTTATVTGAARAVTGQAPLTAVITNTTTGAAGGSIAIAADGSFTTTIAARPGEAISITATDGAARTAGPLAIGVVPFGSTTVTMTIAPGQVGDSFRARTLAREGSMLVVSGWGEEYGTNGNAVVYDVSNPNAPVQRFVKTVANGQSYDMEIVNGWAYDAGWDFCVTNLNDPNAGRVCVDPGSGEFGVAVSGQYAFTSGATNLGAIRMYDVSNPASPRFIRNFNFLPSNANFYDLVAYGADYLIALSPDASTDGKGHDLVVIDRRDVNALVKVVDIDIPNFKAFRGRLEGSTLYIASANDATAMAIVDLTNPLAPVVKSVINSGGRTRGVAPSGGVVATAEGVIGVGFVDATNPGAPVLQGRQFVGGNTWDVMTVGGSLYVANEQGIVVIPGVSMPPPVQNVMVSVSAESATSARAVGAVGAITGRAPITVQAKNLATGVLGSSASVAADGTFSASVAARPGEPLAVLATDTLGAVTGPIPAGPVPFASSILRLRADPNTLGGSFRTRSLAMEGNLLLAWGWGEDYGTNGNAMVFDITDPANPSLLRVKTIANGQAYDVEIVNGWAICAGWDFCTINLSDPNAGRQCIDPGSGELGVAVGGNFAFTSGATNLGAIRVFNITNPGAPQYLGNQNFLQSNANFYDLVAYGTDYLFALSPDTSSNGQGHDLVVFDRRNPTALVKLADIDIPNFSAFRGRVYGTTLYIATAGSSTKMAIVDISNPASPVVKSVVDAGGLTRGVSQHGTRAVTADGSIGVSFFDVTTPTAPLLLGHQFIGGQVWDVLVNGNTIYAATEQNVVAMRNLDAPWTLGFFQQAPGAQMMSLMAKLEGAHR